MSDLVKYHIMKVESLEDMLWWESMFQRETDQIITRFGPCQVLLEIPNCSIDPKYPKGYLIKLDDDFIIILRRLYETHKFLIHYSLDPYTAEDLIRDRCFGHNILDEY